MVLVSHFMEEVEELCDRLAVFDGGRIVALDIPSGLIAHADAAYGLRFRPLGAIDGDALTSVSTHQQSHRLI